MGRTLLWYVIVFASFVVLSAGGCAKDEGVKLYDPDTFAEIGKADKDRMLYTLNSGASFSMKDDQRVSLSEQKTASNDKRAASIRGDSPLSVEQMKAKIRMLDASLKNKQQTGNVSTTARASGRECWLMHEGGVGCFGCYTPQTKTVFEYCWDIQ